LSLSFSGPAQEETTKFFSRGGRQANRFALVTCAAVKLADVPNHGLAHFRMLPHKAPSVIASNEDDLALIVSAVAS